MKQKSKQRKRKHTTATKPRKHEKMPSAQKRGSTPWHQRDYFKTSLGVHLRDKSASEVN